ncbi:nicotinamide-nucleotide adenylyltransferase [Thermogladius sp. 4427co]|uniref:nicotinamide-nucleotide adenylyltransferase n=1 Tax=Thermogladius sp. 4427co TaxID=3450718 RepID=UPI003F78C82C
MVRRVLFPGRFQPFHKGHAYALKWLLERFDEVVVAVGSAQEGFTCENPFTCGERLEMIRGFTKLEGLDDRVWLIPLPDIRMPPAWTAYTLSISPRVDAVASGNPQVLELFKWIRVETVEIPLFNPGDYKGTVVRRLMAHGLEWKQLVPEAVSEFIERINGVERVRRLCRVEAY